MKHVLLLLLVLAVQDGQRPFDAELAKVKAKLEAIPAGEYAARMDAVK